MLDERRSIRWGLVALSSVLIWLVILIVSFWTNPLPRQISGIWFAGCTGGIGTVQYLLSSLFRRRAMNQGFSQRYAIYCLIQPILGFTAGVVIYGTGIILSLILGEEILTEFWVQAILLLLSWFVGYQLIGKSVFERYNK
jgi:hypothetical protein